MKLKIILLILFVFVSGFYLGSFMSGESQELAGSSSEEIVDVELQEHSLAEGNEINANKDLENYKDQLSQAQLLLDEKESEIARLQETMQAYKRAETDPYRPSEDSKDIREALIGEYLELSNSRGIFESIIESSLSNVAGDLDESQKKELAALSKEFFAWDKLEPAFYSIYSEVLTTQELYEINKFYRTEAGRALIDKSPELGRKSMTKIQEVLGNSLPEFQKRIADIMSRSHEAQAH